jgi:hypothetical protein
MKAETTRRSLLPASSERVAHEVDASTLPGGIEHLADGGLDTLVDVGDDQLEAAPSDLARLFKAKEPACQSSSVGLTKRQGL